LEEAVAECVEQGHVEEDDVEWILKAARQLASLGDELSGDLLERSAESFELLAAHGPDAIDPDHFGD
jgi:hypothetical protein